MALDKIADLRQSQLWAQYLQSLGWSVQKIADNFFAYQRKLPAVGAVVKIPRAPTPIPWEKINEIAKKAKAIFIIIEPAVETNSPEAKIIQTQLKNEGFYNENWSLSPTKTILLDLGRSEEQLLSALEKDTRYNIRLAEKKGVMVKETNNFTLFRSLYLDTAKRKKFWPAKKELEALWNVFFKANKASILTAFYKEIPLASCLLIFDQKIAAYQYAASLEKNREVMAPYLLLWKAILFAKKKNCLVFDFEGIQDQRMPSTRDWFGFTLFKKGFGGREVEYIGSFAKYYPLWAKLLFLLNRFL